LKVAVLNEKNKALTGEKHKNRPKQKMFEKQNKGIEERSKRDMESIKTAKDNKAILEKKAQLYEALSKGGAPGTKKDYMVDFQQKKYENQTETEKEIFEEDKNKFYEEQDKIKDEREMNILSRKVGGGLNQQMDQMNAERLSWEAEALREIEEGITEEAIKLRNERVLVQQSYDKKMTNDEKKELVTIIKEEETDKLKADEIKKKRTEFLEQRKQKIRKLNDGQPAQAS